MKDALANLALILGATTGTLTILDWLLTTTQKKKLRSWGDHMWLWLDEQRLGKFANLIVNRTVQVGIAIAAFSLQFLYAFAQLVRESIRNNLTESTQTVLWMIAGFYLVVAISCIVVLRDIHPTVTSWILCDSIIWNFFKRFFKIAVIHTLVQGFILSILYSYLSSPYAQAGFSLACFTIVSPIMIETTLVINTFLLCVFWFIVIIVLMILFRTIQFFLLRIVDYPNGPVLALSGLLIAMASLVKAFLGS